MSNFLPIDEAAKYLGLSSKTLRRWEKIGRLVPTRTDGGHRRYTLEQLEKVKNPPLFSTTYPTNSEFSIEDIHTIKQEVKTYHNRLKIPRFVKIYILFFFLFLVLFFFKKSGVVKSLAHLISSNEGVTKPEVLALITSADLPIFNVNIQADFFENVDFEKDVAVAGTLTVETLIINNNLTAQNITTTGTLTGGTGSITGDLTIGGNIDEINGVNYTFPTADASGFLKSDGSGVLSWSSVTVPTSLSELSGTLTIAKGGTNNSTAYTSGSIIFSDGDKLTQDNTNLSWNDTDNLLKLMGVSYAFPTSQGDAGTLLQNDGSGTLTWSSVGADALTDDSLNFTEFVDSMTLDANLAIASSGSNFSINIDSNTLFVDTANNRVGIGTASPARALDVAGGVVLGSLTSDLITFTGRITSGTSLIPAVDLGSDLGTDLLRFNNLYVNAVNANTASSFTGQAIFSYDPSDTTFTQSSVLINPTSPATNELLLGIGYGGQEKAGFDIEGDLTIGYSGTVTAPTTANPLMIYNHSTTNIFNVDTSGNVTTVDNAWLGLGSGAARLEFDDQTTDEVNILNANVGIGTSTPSQELDVNGDINFTGRILEDGNEIFSGMIAPFASSCPTGWSEYTSARGRYVVGTPSGGTITGTAGTALTDQENRVVGPHTHSINDPGHFHSDSGWAAGGDDSGGCPSGCSSMATVNTGSKVTGITVLSTGTNISATEGTNAPYIQLTYCQKTAGADVAEWTPSEQNLTAGDIVKVDPNNTEHIELTTQSYDSTAIGVISTNPGWTVGAEETGSFQLALVGRVPVKISNESESIKIGDYITTSNEPGKGMKADRSGRVIGIAYESWDKENPKESVVVFVNPTFYLGDINSEGILDIDRSLIATDVNVNLLANSYTSLFGSTDEHEDEMESDHDPEGLDSDTVSVSIAQALDKVSEKLSSIESDITLLKASSLGSVASDSGTFNDINVIGNAVLGDTVVNGKLNIGSLTIDNLESSIDAIGILRIQPLALGNVEFMGGSFEIDTDGNINLYHMMV